MDLRRVAVIAIIMAAVVAFVLTAYSVFIKRRAEHLLAELSYLNVGTSSSADAERIAKAYSASGVSRDCENGKCVQSFRIANGLLSTLRLEPSAIFTASITVEDNRVTAVHAALIRSMPIYPTFPASAGMIEEDVEFPVIYRDRAHYFFPTPVGKPYLRVALDSHATAVEKRHAFDLSMRCLIKPGRGCDLPCDYLPSAWQDWQTEVVRSGFDLRTVYRNSERCAVSR